MRLRDWKRSTDPVAMLHSVSLLVPLQPGEVPTRERTTRVRRLRVFTLTAAQPVLDRVAHPACHAAAVMGWKLAEGTATPDELVTTVTELYATWRSTWDAANLYFDLPPETGALLRLVNLLTLLINEPEGAARNLVEPIQLTYPGTPGSLLTPDELRGCCPLLRDVFGPRGIPILPQWWDESWHTQTAVALARRAYEDGQFAAMPILADALQDAGCNDPEVLGHCRGPEPHVRGCWVVDALLRKT